MTRSRVVLPAPLEPISPVNSPAPTAKLTWSRICRPPSDTLTPSTSSTVAPRQIRRHSGRRHGRGTVTRHSCSVEVPVVTAFSMALTSASIQDWKS